MTFLENQKGLFHNLKTKAKPQRRISASSSTKTIPLGESTWTDIEAQDFWSIDFQCRRNSW